MPDYLKHVLTSCRDNEKGALTDYIPELAAVDPDKFALALSTVDGTIYSTGDDEVEFTMQSMSKPFAYALALQKVGLTKVMEKVGVEPSGEAFNQISLEKDSNIPKNPMINSGAITTHSLIPYKRTVSRAEQLRRFLSGLAGCELSFDTDVYKLTKITNHAKKFF